MMDPLYIGLTYALAFLAGVCFGSSSTRGW